MLYLITRSNAVPIRSTVNSCCVIPHLSLAKSVDEEEQQGQREDGRHAASHETKPDVCCRTTVFWLTVVA